MPLSHVAANLVDLIIMMSCHGTTYFAEKTALKGTITQTLKVWKSSDNFCCDLGFNEINAIFRISNITRDI